MPAVGSAPQDSTFVATGPDAVESSLREEFAMSAQRVGSAQARSASESASPVQSAASLD